MVIALSGVAFCFPSVLVLVAGTRELFVILCCSFGAVFRSHFGIKVGVRTSDIFFFFFLWQRILIFLHRKEA